MLRRRPRHRHADRASLTAPAPPAPLGFWAYAASDPDRVAVVDTDGAPVAAGALLAQSRAVARAFHALGLRRGDTVALIMANHPAFFACWLAASESGLYVVPVNAHLAAAEAAYVVANSEARALVGHEEVAGLCRAAAIEAGLGPDRCFAVGEVDGFGSYDELATWPDGPQPPRAAGALMMYTSGTTGAPKGVRRPLPDTEPDAVAATAAAALCQGFGITVGRGVHLVCGPLYHAGPYTGASNALHAGHTVVLMGSWTAEAFLDLVEQHRVTNTQMVPTMFNRLLALPAVERERRDLSSLESVFHTGAPCPVDLKHRLMEWLGPIVYETYGGTEGAATVATPRRWLEKPGTVGRPIVGATVKILDDDGNECPPDTVGTIYVGSDRHAATEYFKDPTKTASIRRGGLITLGDVGYLDDDGFLFLCDRRIDMIISGGVNIYPAEVEACLLGHPAVADATVIGIPDDEWGEQVKAIVELVETAEPSDTLAADIIEHCRARIARFKCPRTVDFVDRLPRLPNGKIEKRRLREPFWAGRERAI